MGRESTVEKKIVMLARDKGVLTRKFSSPSNAGVPDRIFMWNGRTLFLEIKRLGFKPTALQYDEMEGINRQGIPATWVDTYADAYEMIDMWRKWDIKDVVEECMKRNLESQKQ
jgi:hypothetical protein